jgi:hypothetical protein
MNGFQAWFALLFPPLLLVMPLVSSLFVSVSPIEPGDPENRRTRIRRWSLALWAGTLASLALHQILFWWISPPWAQQAWVLCFALWFGLAMPLWRAENPDLFCGAPEGLAQRSAPLRPRKPVVPLRALWLGFLVWGLAVALTIASALTREQEQHVALTHLLIFDLSGLVFLLGFAMGSRRISLEPEPMDAGNSPELREAYESLRHAKGWAFFTLGFLGMLAFVLPPALLAWDQENLLMPAVLIGAIGGTVVGIAGGIVGAVLGMRRARITAMLREISARSA